MHSSLLEEMGNSTINAEDSWVNDLDPMLEGGYRIAYNRACPFEVRQKTQDQSKEIGSRDILNVRILVIPSPQQYSQLRIQISSESDLFMILQERIDDKKFNWIKKQQGLNFPFEALLPMLVKQFNLCNKHPQQYCLVLYLNSVGKHRLTIIENIQYKSIELISLQFAGIQEQLLKQNVSYRFSLMKAKNERVQLKSREMLGLVKLKNPNLLQTIAKKTNSTVMNTTNMLNSTRSPH